MSAGRAAHPRGVCGTCARFIADRPAIEAAIPTLAIFGSAYASVAWDDGLCGRWDAMRSPRDTCEAYCLDPIAAQGEGATPTPGAVSK
jgi:hypothetical protein